MSMLYILHRQPNTSSLPVLIHLRLKGVYTSLDHDTYTILSCVV